MSHKETKRQPATGSAENLSQMSLGEGPGHPKPRGSFSIISLGCPKNLVDSEQIGAQLTAAGLRFTPKLEGADLIVVNTCGFLAAAREESLRAIHEAVDLKRRGFARAVIVTGCLSQWEGEKLLELCPGVDQVVGVWGEPKLGELATAILTTGRPADGRAYLPLEPTAQTSQSQTAEPFPPRLRLTLPHVAYLKIAEGCDRFCTFCTIPKIRGHYRSRPLDSLVAEAQALAASGVRELILVAQDTTYYGVDIIGRPLLAELLKRLDRIEGLLWIRLLYLYPTHVTEELVHTVANCKRVIPYLDLPLQHINDKILRRMNRQVSREEIERLLAHLRESLPGLVLRTTFLTGFPGETEAEFAELCEFVRQQRFEHLGVFAYSPEPNTPALKLEDQVPEAERKRRAERLMAIQQEIAFAWLESQIGSTVEVLIDLRVPGEKDAFVGRTYAQAPEIDGVVYVTGRGLRPGMIVPCELVARHGYDLVAAAVGKPR
ncbi:MAG: 30S ribosomal protein S12 methylthiotransferase RimO [Thermoguttaceae bacterium]|nr:30S ribosomal protein S12 methylthiotransferase RimO [Thermoguttaceae bacterium]MDW8078449.1 30S ribosomal protein S12 methylthiotransferase RimO [Thermoguttaceae bacterium]